MQQYRIKTDKKPIVISFIITTNGLTVPVYIVGVDPLTRKTNYFQSRFNIKGKETITLPCPQTPVILDILIWSEKNLPFEVANISTAPLNRPLITDPSLILIERFARRAGRLTIGSYKHGNSPVTIQLLRRINNENGKEHTTPARIHVTKPIIQVSQKKIINKSVPERVMILVHEYSHNFKNYNPDNEPEADYNGATIYKTLGYPNIEGFNAFANIMEDKDTDENFDRLVKLQRILS